MYGGLTFNFELKAPAAHSLICWGEIGLAALVEGAIRTATSKNVSLTIQILSALAAGEFPTFITLGMTEPKLVDTIKAAFKAGIVPAVAARQRLNDYMLSLPDDDSAATAVGGSLQLISFHGVAPAKELFAALATRWLAVSKPTMEGYKNLLRTHPADEAKFQAFFERFPQVLDPMAMQVWPQPDFHGAKEPDFVVRRTDNSYLIVEIETPAKLIVTKDNQISAQVTHAITQVMQYRSFLLERYQEANAHFPEFQEPDCLVVIGRETDLDKDQQRALLLENQHRKGVRVVGFDWIASRAEAITQNIISGRTSVHSLRIV
jgi:Domain of unknown function (DUF4263)